ncbi:acetyltransferase [Vibrio cholerae]|nr:acetyltransferase [Vibrio cholerae]
MVTVVVFEFSVMRCLPLRRALGLLGVLCTYLTEQS